MIRKSSIFLFCFAISGCAVGPIAAVGVGSIAVTETTGKGIADHGMSMARGEDCRISRVFKDQQVCNPTVDGEEIVSIKSTTDNFKRTEDIYSQRIKQNGIKSH